LNRRSPNALDRVITWIRSVPGLRLIWEIHERFSPLRFFSESTRIVEQEVIELQTAISGKRSLTIYFDEEVSPPGLGDVLTVAILARGLSRVTEVSILIVSENISSAIGVSKNIRSENSNQVVRIISEFAPTVSIGYTSDDGTLLDTKNHVVFSSLVASKRDITRYMLLLIRELDSRRIAPIEFFKLGGKTRVQDRTNFIGYPLRRSSTDSSRNTRTKTFLRDIKTLRANYPQYKIKLFGFEDEVDYFSKLLDSEGLYSGVVPQNATTFVDAVREALCCDLWVQRLGGGMAVAVFFSELSFTIFSKDSVMARQLGYRIGKLLPWHSSSQIYQLRPFSVGYAKFDRTLSQIMENNDF